MMRYVFQAFLIGGITLTAACTSLQPTEASPQEIQRLILTERRIDPGQRVRLVTADEVAHEFRVTEIDFDQRLIHGAAESVQIDEIVALETRQISVGKTALLTGGLVYGAAIIIAIAIAPALILGGG